MHDAIQPAELRPGCQVLTAQHRDGVYSLAVRRPDAGLAGAPLCVSALLVAHGKNDPRVPFSEAEQIAAKVRARGRTVWTVFADNEGHGFNKKDNSDYLQAVQAWFLKQSLAAGGGS